MKNESFYGAKKNDSIVNMPKEQKKIKAGVSLREYYVRRNEMLVERKQKSLSIRAQ